MTADNADGVSNSGGAAELTGSAPGPGRRGVPASRRELLFGAGIAGAAGAIGWYGRDTLDRPSVGSNTDDIPPRPDREQAGIVWPPVAPRHLRALILDASGPANAVGILEAAAAAEAQLASADWLTDDAGEITITVGFAPGVAAAQFAGRADIDDLPDFANDASDIVSGGDVLVLVAAGSAFAATKARKAAVDAIAEVTPARARWEQAGFRDDPLPGGTTRTSTGFIDGIMNPRNDADLEAGVWRTGRRDTCVVVRRMRIAPTFAQLGRVVQEAAIGRRRETGAPLSGGGPLAAVDLSAKGSDGVPNIPAGAHARRAHPANIGRPLMLRRSYGYDNGSGDSGLLFLAFLADPTTFVLTQQRLDEVDDLIAHTTTDRSGLFFVPERA